jgi:hypothetical protein
MSIQVNEISENCTSYYFADHCLTIDRKNLLTQPALENFTDKQPYSTGTSLRVCTYEPLDESDSILTAEESGVSILHRPSGQWILKSSDPSLSCRIESNDSYSTLTGFVSGGEGSESKQIQDCFLQLLRIATESFLCCHRGLSIHASCVKHEGKTVLFTAPSETGKSTQAALWIRLFGDRLISGDRPHLRILSDKISAYGVPWDGKEQQFAQDFAPAAAIIEVRQAKENRVRVLSREQAFRLLLTQSFIPMWDDQAKFSVIQSIRTIANRVPFYRLFCNMEEDAAQLLEGIVFQQEKDQMGRQEKDMKIKDGFILRSIVDEWIVMPKGTNIKTFEGAIVLNEVSAHIWRQLERPISKEDLLQSILDEFDVTGDAARADLDEFLNKLRERDILLEE